MCLARGHFVYDYVFVITSVTIVYLVYIFNLLAQHKLKIHVHSIEYVHIGQFVYIFAKQRLSVQL
jgi:hypothetical protein